MLNNEIFEIFTNAKRILVFTGAGMSTDSGIPDFRSKEGLYRLAPERILSREFYATYTEMFYEFLFQKLYHPEAKPNKGHQLLAQWEQMGIEIDIVTQNMDGLHVKAGSKNVIEFHGSIHTATCQNPFCKKSYTIEEVLQRKATNDEFFICDCNSERNNNIIKPDFVLFDEKGEWMTEDNLHLIRSKAYKADVILVLGSSLQVYPFRTFIDNKPHFKPMVIINKDRVAQESMPNTYAIHESISDSLSEIHSHLTEHRFPSKKD